jgi:excisionase family DNA binding protein
LGGRKHVSSDVMDRAKDNQIRAHGPREEMRNTTMTVEQKLLTPKEVARWLDVSIDWVHNHATRKEPRLPVVRIGKLLRFRNEDVEAFIRGRAARMARSLPAMVHEVRRPDGKG